MTDLSASYATSVDLLEQSKAAEAAVHYRRYFVPTVKKLYVEAGKTYPLRYEGATCWTAWTKQLYILTRKAEDAFEAGDVESAKKFMAELRRHFYDLHEQTGRLKANDQIYAFQRLVLDEGASQEGLRAALDKVVNADPPLKVNADDFTQARDEWKGAVTPMIDGFSADKRDDVLKSTEAFYKSFGTRFE